MASTTGAGESLSHAVSNPEWPLAWLTSFPPATVSTGHRAGDRPQCNTILLMRWMRWMRWMDVRAANAGQ